MLPAFGAERRLSLRILSMSWFNNVNAKALRSVGLWTGALQVLSIPLRPSDRYWHHLRSLDTVASNNPFLKEVYVILRLLSEKDCWRYVILRLAKSNKPKVKYGPLVVESDMLYILSSFAVCPVLDCLLVQDDCFPSGFTKNPHS